MSKRPWLEFPDYHAVVDDDWDERDEVRPERPVVWETEPRIAAAHDNEEARY